MSPKIPEPDYDDPKEIYAFFGLAAYSAQPIEQGLLNLLVGLQIAKLVPMNSKNAMKLYEKGDKKTLGQVLHALRNITQFDIFFEKNLIKVLQKRNHLMHQFFVDNSENLLFQEGRNNMINQLIESIKLFQLIDPQIDMLWHKIWVKYGFTEEIIKQEVEKMKNKHQ